MRLHWLVFLLFPTLLLSQNGLIADKAMVVSAREEASQIGVAILKKGGNAFDAMIATQLALAVAYPYAGNISGGGFLVFRKANGETGTLDFREKAPLKATKNMYLDKNGNVIPNLSTDSALSVGVPGSVAAIFEVHRKYGSLPLKDLFQPAIDLAKRGIVVTEKEKAKLDEYKADIVKISGKKTLYNKTFNVGDTIKYLALANTLEQIVKQGEKEFYSGKTAKKLVEFIQSKGGIISKKDLKQYKTVWRKPITFQYKDLNVFSMAPPSSGGITLGQIMKMIEPYPLNNYGHNTTQYIQLITEAERRAYADRNYFLGDPDFVKIPQQKLLNDDYLKQRMASFSFDKPTPSSEISHGDTQIVESDETTHFSIVDSFGNAVAVTTTLNGAYGSKIYCDELGFFLNNQMDDFVSKPGIPNYYGLLGEEANSIAPQKRMLSSMTPTIVERNGKLLMLLGSPGGSTIITSVLQTILNVYEFKMGMQEAVNQHRFHHQYLPDEIMLEPNKFSKEVINQLTDKGYHTNEKFAPVIGKIDAILVLPNGKLEAGADGRGDDKAVGF
ncbi:gamma-glutamyltransferase [Flavobacterium capsici]|uniref:Glutathione hydrolase proenzyme n=1 Tax=Flavobacterium capsici TaxID=3075618 RepID=A0AA96F3A1_9FLAO|nr:MULTISPECIES: gamma-glutamyltransferase [unclassified Flavobacterium]WNM17879.1 gamma-glutamyltransferase [Flavobacterium sp. PMR2A8]WNM21932.1 gamma-glutamyltransferase [Flavobacterium sp. PMTSA4]